MPRTKTTRDKSAALAAARERARLAISAFPETSDTFGGMRLRDWFAGQALVGLFSNQHELAGTAEQYASLAYAYASLAYAAADAMLRARDAAVAEAG